MSAIRLMTVLFVVVSISLTNGQDYYDDNAGITAEEDETPEDQLKYGRSDIGAKRPYCKDFEEDCVPLNQGFKTCVSILLN